MSTIRVLTYALCFVFVAGTAGCIPNNSSPIPKKNSTSSTSRTTSSTKSTTASDGAKGVCLAYNVGDPTRELCKSCYTSVLASNCPGFTDISTCPNTSLISTFNNLVTQCVSTAQNTQGSCPTTLSCPSGMTQSSVSCSCVPIPSGQTGSTDTGQLDNGPPILSPLWPSQTVASPLPDTAYDSTLPFNPVGIIAQPRGGQSIGSITIDNPSYSCKQGGTTFTNGVDANYFLSAPSTLTLNSTSGRFEHQFNFYTTGYKEFCFNGNCGTREGFWIRPAGTAGANQSLTIHRGSGIDDPSANIMPVTVGAVAPDATVVGATNTFYAYNTTASGGLIVKDVATGFTSNRGLQITITPNPGATFRGGLYNLFINLHLFDKWEGLKDGVNPHQIIVQLATTGGTNITRDIFKESFSNNSLYQQSFTGAPVNTAADYYEPLTVVTKPGLDSTNATAVAETYDRTYNITVPFSISTDVTSMVFLIYAKNTALFPASAATVNNIQQSFGFSRIGLTPVPTCGVKYHVVDGAGQSNNYCMRFNVSTTCSPMINNSPCTTYALPAAGAEGAGYFEQQNSQASCP